MTIRLTCPCGKRMRVREVYAGRSFRCPGCSRPLQVPHEATPPSDPVQPAPLRPARAPVPPPVPVEADFRAPRLPHPQTAFRSAAAVFALLGLGVGVLLLAACGLAAAAGIKPEPLIAGGVLAILWLGGGGLALARRLWSVFPLLVLAHLAFLLFACFLLIPRQMGMTPNDMPITQAVGMAGLLLSCLVLAQGYAALFRSFSPERPHPLGGFYCVFAGIFLAVVGTGLLLQGVDRPDLRQFQRGSRVSVQSPYFDAVGERVDGRWVWRILRDEPPLFGFPVSRSALLVTGIVFLVPVPVLLLRPWRWLARRPAETLH